MPAIHKPPTNTFKSSRPRHFSHDLQLLQALSTRLRDLFHFFLPLCQIHRPPVFGLQDKICDRANLEFQANNDYWDMCGPWNIWDQCRLKHDFLFIWNSHVIRYPVFLFATPDITLVCAPEWPEVLGSPQGHPPPPHPRHAPCFGLDHSGGQKHRSFLRGTVSLSVLVFFFSHHKESHGKLLVNKILHLIIHITGAARPLQANGGEGKTQSSSSRYDHYLDSWW